jgi:hypothetical protein
MREVETGLGGGSDTLLTVEEAMRFLRVRSRNTLWTWEREGHRLAPVNIGRPGAVRRTLRYRLSDLRQLAGGSDEWP